MPPNNRPKFQIQIKFLALFPPRSKILTEIQNDALAFLFAPLLRVDDFVHCDYGQGKPIVVEVPVVTDAFADEPVRLAKEVPDYGVAERDDLFVSSTAEAIEFFRDF